MSDNVVKHCVVVITMVALVILFIALMTYFTPSAEPHPPQSTMVIHVDTVVIGNTEVIELVEVEEDTSNPLNVSWGGVSLDVDLQPNRLLDWVLRR